MNPGYVGSGKCGNVYEFVQYALPTATFTPSAYRVAIFVIAIEHLSREGSSWAP